MYKDGGLAVAPEQTGFTLDHLPLDGGSSWRPPPSDSSDISVPTRGWASAAGSIQSHHTGYHTPLDAVWALEPKQRSCHLCFEVGQFLMECPLLGSEAKRTAQTSRAENFSGSRLHPQTSPVPTSPRRYRPASAQPPRYGQHSGRLSLQILWRRLLWKGILIPGSRWLASGAPRKTRRETRRDACSPYFHAKTCNNFK
jgi:hypothetical protein